MPCPLLPPQAVGCDRQLGSSAKEDNCGVCAGDGSTCRLVRGQAKIHLAPEKRKFWNPVPCYQRSICVFHSYKKSISLQFHVTTEQAVFSVLTGKHIPITELVWAELTWLLFRRSNLFLFKIIINFQFSILKEHLEFVSFNPLKVPNFFWVIVITNLIIKKIFGSYY